MKPPHPCASCPTEVPGRATYCAVCKRKRDTAGMQVVRDRYRAKRREIQAKRAPEPEIPWSPAPPLLTRQIEYEPDLPSVGLAAQRLEQVVAQCVKISGGLDIGGDKPHEQRVREAMAAYRASGGDEAGLERAVQAGSRSAGHTFRLPNVEIGTPAQDIAEHSRVAQVA